MSTEYMQLLGVEQIQSAARNMIAAADQMQRATSQLEFIFEQHSRKMEELVGRLEQIGPDVKVSDLYLQTFVPDVRTIPKPTLLPQWLRAWLKKRRAA